MLSLRPSVQRLVALNTERAAEEQRGIIRWLRPEYQKREEMTQTWVDFDEQAFVAAPDGKGGNGMVAAIRCNSEDGFLSVFP